MTDQLQEVDRDAWLDGWVRNEPASTLRTIVVQLRADLFNARSELQQRAETPSKAKYHTPGPQEIALAMGAALAASGKYETPGAALTAAWMAVPEYFTGRAEFLKLASILAGSSPNEGESDERSAETA